MNNVALQLNHDTDLVFEELLEELTARVNAGELIDVAACVAAHPEYAGRLEGLLPAMQMLVAFGHSESACSDGAVLPTVPDTGVLGDFRILREIGRGGMGVVYEAEQISLGRRVALKVLPLAATLSQQQLDRFKNEARTAATLKHAHIVAVHSVGVERGVHYYAMELVEGRSLAEVVAELRKADSRMHAEDVAADDPASQLNTQPAAALSTVRTHDQQRYYRHVAELITQAADALDYAHEQGVVHRDIKPANLLVDKDLKLSIADFGLARLETELGVTLTGDLLGTLRYMSPEQAAGKSALVDYRTDIHALGATLYELIALEPAFGDADRVELLRKIANYQPRPLRQCDSRIPTDLETITMKALEKDREDRYGSAGEFAVDLRNFLEHRPITAERPSLAQRGRKWVRRHTALVISAVAVMSVGITGLAIAAGLVAAANDRTAAERDAAEENLRIAADAIDQLLAQVAEDADMQGQLPQSQALFAKAAGAYDRVLANTSDPELVLKAAAARARLAEVEAESGRGDQALKEAERGLQLLRELPTNSVVSKHELQLRGWLLSIQGNALLGEHKYDAAEWSLAEALHLREQLLDSTAGHSKYRRDLVIALNNLAVLKMETGQLDAGERLLQRALAVRAALPNDQLDDGAWLSEAAGLTCNLGTIDRDRGKYAEAERDFRDAIRLGRQAIARQPDYQVYRHDLYNFRWSLADALVRAGRHAEAAAEVASIVSEFPERLQAYVEGVWLLMQCEAIADATDADGYLTVAREILASTSTATFAPPAIQQELAWLLAACPVRELRDGDAAVQIADQLCQRDAENFRFQRALSAAYLEIDDFDRAFLAAELAMQASDGGATYEHVLLALAQSGRGEPGAARKRYAQALEAHERLGSRAQYRLAALMDDAKSIFDADLATSTPSHSGDQ